MAQLAVWIYTCFMHRFVEERRKDYFVMYLHHVVTITLVGACCFMRHFIDSAQYAQSSVLLGARWACAEWARLRLT